MYFNNFLEKGIALSGGLAGNDDNDDNDNRNELTINQLSSSSQVYKLATYYYTIGNYKKSYNLLKNKFIINNNKQIQKLKAKNKITFNGNKSI